MDHAKTYSDLSKSAQHRAYRAYKAINAAIEYLSHTGILKNLYKEELITNYFYLPNAQNYYGANRPRGKKGRPGAGGQQGRHLEGGGVLVTPPSLQSLKF